MKSKTHPQHNRITAKQPMLTPRPTANGELPIDRPWTPAQIFLATFLFGVLAGTVSMALNYGRMREPRKALLWLIGSLVITPISMVLCLKANIPAIGFAASLLFGLFFMFLQQSTFESWKSAAWDVNTTDAYKPNQIGKLFGVAIVCCVFQLLAGVALAVAMNVQ